MGLCRGCDCEDIEADTYTMWCERCMVGAVDDWQLMSQVACGWAFDLGMREAELERTYDAGYDRGYSKARATYFRGCEVV